MAAFIHFDRISKAFGAVQVVKDLNLEVEEGRIPQPARPVRLRQDDDPDDAGRLRDADQRPDPARRHAGSISCRPISGRWAWSSRTTHCFRIMTVAENVAFPLEMRGLPRAGDRSRA